MRSESKPVLGKIKNLRSFGTEGYGKIVVGKKYIHLWPDRHQVVGDFVCTSITQPKRGDAHDVMVELTRIIDGETLGQHKVPYLQAMNYREALLICGGTFREISSEDQNYNGLRSKLS